MRGALLLAALAIASLPMSCSSSAVITFADLRAAYERLGWHHTPSCRACERAVMRRGWPRPTRYRRMWAEALRGT